MSVSSLLEFLKARVSAPPAPLARAACSLRLEALEQRVLFSGGSGWIADPVGDFLPTYTGPHHPGLDVTHHRATVLPNHVLFAGKMAGDIAPTQAIGGIYVIGVDRGQGTPRFLSGTPQIGPNVTWDLIVRINPNGTGVVNNQLAGVVTPIDPANITIDGNEFSANIPLSMLLPASTKPPGEWTYNLWPRNGIVPGQNQHVSDLGPDDGNSPMQVRPMPGPVNTMQAGPVFAQTGGNSAVAEIRDELNVL